MSPRPIGYWIKEVDRLLDAVFARTLASERCGRRHWQLLNTLQDGSRTEAELEDALAPFVSAGAGTVRSALGELARRGWVEKSDGARLQLTDAGRQAHVRLQGLVGAHRRRSAEGVSEAEYRTALAVLERMAANLQTFLGEAAGSAS